MKKLLLLILIFSCSSICIAQGSVRKGFGQRKTDTKDKVSLLDPYKYVYVEAPKYEGGGVDIYGLSSVILNAFKSKGLIPVAENQIQPLMNEGKYCDLVRVQISHRTIPISYYSVGKSTLTYFNCKNQNIGNTYAQAGNDLSGAERDIKVATKKAAEYAVKYYNYKPFLTPKIDKVGFSFSEIDPDLVGTSEVSIKEYFNKNGVKNIEGIWGSTTNGNSYKLAIFYKNDKYFVTIIEGFGLWQPGELKAEFEEASVEEVLTIKWNMGNKLKTISTTGLVKNNALIEFDLPTEGGVLNSILYKIYPKIGKNKMKTKTGEWAGNGSGIIISKSGYIVTNHHVIEGADDIEVEFIVDGEVQKFNAEIVQSDKVNDLAVIKIFDMNFDGLDNLPYNFKTRSSDVGTKVYAYGYPMALSLMGKEIKITDGIISSKSGFDGDITSYQITAPIQAGNSGGPLFDDRGNFIGINSAGLRKDVADNVGYTIKSSYLLNLIDVLPKSIDLPSSNKLQSLPLTEQIKEISKYVVLVKVK